MTEPTAAETDTTVIQPLREDERAELLRLRGEVDALRKAPRRRRVPNWKAVAAGFLITLGCVLAPLSLLTVWVHNQVANTDRFVATMSPLIEQPSVQAAVTDRVTDTIFGYVDVQAYANQAVDALAAQGLSPVLVDRLHSLTGPLASSLQGFVHDQVGTVVASSQVRAVWDQALRGGHEQLNAVLSGNASAISIVAGKVQLDLGPVITAAKQRLVANGFTAVNAVPDVHPTLAVGDAQTLIKARSAYNTLDTVATWLPWVTLVLLAAGVYLARNHRRALLNTGFGIATGMVVIAVALFIVRGVLIDNVPSRSAAPVSDSYDLLVRFLRDGLRVVFVVGLLIGIGAFLAGPSPTAVHLRAASNRLIVWLRRGGAKAGLRTGKLGGWVHDHRVPLRAGVVGVAVLVFVFLIPPSGLAAIVVALVLLVCLAVIQFLDQPSPGAQDRPTGTGTA
ncbi:hypothetical protein LWP59_18130 [Amycolatopsis acidiphila]|uniref:Integral membrane protein n=1 Tax=Amycolatopsis acidiphila TaxID=715473 RepID=A0A558ANP6_9PSEU|nr:hypothetical protein [Amycolatopsis acidiphila]TVT25884.1 hypothetical protein FNH06_00105 [Amycolatopsis acidiphila]UIJ63418.1 hypothetical protein LWP59_18130 [Amycolatopsis acidiphila]GHG75480.1 hypothetical protein GCM10017788_40480 [Amycolatopsis acidiphila]